MLWAIWEKDLLFVVLLKTIYTVLFSIYWAVGFLCIIENISKYTLSGEDWCSVKKCWINRQGSRSDLGKFTPLWKCLPILFFFPFKEFIIYQDDTFQWWFIMPNWNSVRTKSMIKKELNWLLTLSIKSYSQTLLIVYQVFIIISNFISVWYLHSKHQLYFSFNLWVV